MTRIFRHLLPALVVFGTVFPGALLLVRLSQPLRFAVAALALLMLGYVLARLDFLNHRLDVEARARAARLLKKKDSLPGMRPSWPLDGYVALLGSALAFAYAFAYARQVPAAVAAGVVLWWWSDRVFTRTSAGFFAGQLTPAAPATPLAPAVAAPHKATAPAGASKPAAKPGAGPAAKPAAAPAEPFDEAAAKHKILMRAIAEKKKEDPLVGIKIGAQEINHRLLKAMKSEKGVHAESLLTALGALAGYACQASLRSEALSRGEGANSPFIEVKTADGKRYFYGDPLNHRLFEGHYSVWNIVTSGLRIDGLLETVPDMHPLFEHVTGTIGTEQFGLPRFPEGHNAGDLPINYLKGLWPKLLPLVKEMAPRPEEWPVLYGCALQEILRMTKGVMPPELALQVIMESAVPMSKVDLQTA